MQRKSLHLWGIRARRKIWSLRQRFRLLPHDNVGYNRALWDFYARSWDDPQFVRDQLDPRLEPPAPGELDVVGEEWADTDDLDFVVNEYILRYVTPESVAVEIGVGGGRVAQRVAPRVGRLLCFDVSPAMLKRARGALSQNRNVEFTRLSGPRLPDSLTGTVDFVYAFDVFMHLDLHTMWRYLQEMARVLKSGGHALFHVPNLTAPAGWEMFLTQQRYSVEDGWFLSPEMVRTLVAHTDLELVEESQPDGSNLYLNRDYFAVLEKR